MSDEQTALARRLLIIDFGYTGEHVTWHEESDTQLWRNTVTKARLLVESPEWKLRGGAPTQASGGSDTAERRADSLQTRIKREGRKSAAANRENEALRAEVRKVRFQKQIEQRDAVNGGYVQRYERVMETFGMIRDLLDTTVLHGLPVPVSTTLEPESSKEGS